MKAQRWRAFAALFVVVALAACGSTGRTADTRRGVTQAAATPLRDIGVIRPDIPPLLRNLEYPYSTASLASGCPAVAYEIGELDAVLGPESFQPGPERNIWDKGGDLAERGTIAAAQSAANGLIPFRSWVRLITGASAAERDALRAFANGQQRRTFLRGYGASLGCPNVVPPPAPITHATPPPQPARANPGANSTSRTNPTH
jgi:hypothetical protein